MNDNSLKIGPYFLSNRMIKNMRHDLDSTVKTRLEHGFNLCDSNGKLLKRNGHVGNRDDITISTTCDMGEKHVGAFHTHPDDISRITSADMIEGCLNDIECVGSGLDGKINCFVRKDIGQSSHNRSVHAMSCKNNATVYFNKVESPLENRGKIMKNITNGNSELDKYKEDVQSYEDGLMKLINKYFDKVEIN